MNRARAVRALSSVERPFRAANVGSCPRSYPRVRHPTYRRHSTLSSFARDAGTPRPTSVARPPALIASSQSISVHRRNRRTRAHLVDRRRPPARSDRPLLAAGRGRTARSRSTADGRLIARSAKGGAAIAAPWVGLLSSAVGSGSFVARWAGRCAAREPKSERSERPQERTK